MANSPTDLGKHFVESGMSLITQPASDRWLNMVRDRKAKKERQTNYAERLND